MHDFNSSSFSGDWISFSADLVRKHERGKAAVKELCLYCKNFSAVQAMAGLYPDEVSNVLDGIPETVQFPDGSGVVRFFVRNGTQIPNVLFLVGRKDYGDVSVTINGGICPGLPEKSRQLMRQMIGTDQAFMVQGTFFW
jgi:hypothetical protein